MTRLLLLGSLLLVAAHIAAAEPPKKIDTTKFGDRPFAIFKLPGGEELAYVHGKFDLTSAIQFSQDCGLSLFTVRTEREAESVLKELNSKSTDTKITKAAKSEGRLGVFLGLVVESASTPKQVVSIYTDHDVDTAALVRKRILDSQRLEAAGEGEICCISRSGVSKQWGMRTLRLATDTGAVSGVLLSTRPATLKPSKAP